jgi:hypothetical protein
VLSSEFKSALAKLGDTSIQVISHQARLVQTIPMDEEDEKLQRANAQVDDGANFQWGVVIASGMVAFRLKFWVKSANVIVEADVAVNWEVLPEAKLSDDEVKSFMLEYGAAATHGAALTVLHMDLQLLATNGAFRFSIEKELLSDLENNFDSRVTHISVSETDNADSH